MRSRIVLDAAAFDVIDSSEGLNLRALLERAVARDSEVVTSDPDDITRLATAIRGVRVVTRSP